jgi:hypothetical protein
LVAERRRDSVVEFIVLWLGRWRSGLAPKSPILGARESIYFENKFDKLNSDDS